MTNNTGDGIGRAWIPGSIALILLATLTPQPDWSVVRQDFFAPLLPTRVGQWRDAIQNVLLYLPFGILLALKSTAFVRAVLWAATVSLIIELLQLWVPGRDAVAVDVVTNTMGTLVGWLAASTRFGLRARTLILMLERWLAAALRPERPVAAALSLGWAMFVSVVAITVCGLMSPALPPPFFYAVAAPSIDSASGQVRIGSDGTPSGVFPGLIDEVRVYEGARTTDDIRLDMERPLSSEEPHDPNLVAAYGFDSNEREATSDATGRGNQAVVRHAMWTAEGRFGGALAFDGRASEVVASSGADFRKNVTLEAWVFPVGTMRGDVPVIADSRDVYYLRASSGISTPFPAAGARFGGAPRVVRARRPIPRDRWTHLATTFDGQFLRLYVDGQLSATLRHWSSHQPLHMSLNGADLPFGRVSTPSDLPELLLNKFSLGITLRCGELQNQPAPAFLLAGLQSVEVLALEAAGSELRVRSSTWARRLGLASAYFRVPNVLSRCSTGQTLSLVLKGPLQNPSIEDQSGVQMAGAGVGVGSGWTLLVDSQLMPVWLVAALSTCYLAVLAIPFGFWARPKPLTAVGALLIVATFYLAPRAWNIRPIDGDQIAALVIGVLLGILARRMGARIR